MGEKSLPIIWAEYLTARFLLTALSVLPTPAGAFLSRQLMRLAYHFHTRLRITGQKNLGWAFPDLSEAEREAILRGEFDSLGRVIHSASRFGRLTRENLSQCIEQTADAGFLTDYQRVKASGRGRIIISAHLGNWELLALAYSVLFEQWHFLARKLDNPKLDDYLERLRTGLGSVQINKTKSTAAILRVLRNGGVVGMASDVNTSRDEGVFVPFFGIPVSTTKGPAMLALRSGAVLIPVFALWNNERGKYFIEHGCIIEPESTGDMAADIITITAAFTREIEDCIRKYPDQWLWVHRRWKTRPQGEAEIY